MKSNASEGTADESGRKCDVLEDDERRQRQVRRDTYDSSTLESFRATLPRRYARDGFERVVLKNKHTLNTELISSGSRERTEDGRDGSCGGCLLACPSRIPRAPCRQT